MLKPIDGQEEGPRRHSAGRKGVWPAAITWAGRQRRPLAAVVPLLVGFLWIAGGPSAAVGQDIFDRVRTARGTETGEIVDMTSTEVKVNRRNAGVAAVPVNEIRGVSFDGEPSELLQARVKATNGAYAEAAALLAKIDASSVKRPLVKQDIDFYQAFSAAQLALEGRGTINEAGRQLNSFVRANPRNYHYYEAVKAMGDLLAADGKLDLAQRQYLDYAAAPWPEYRARATNAIGHAMQSQGRHAEAIQQFDVVLNMTAAPHIKSEQLTAALGKAVSLAETDQLETAVGMVEQVIQDADPEQKELHARAYNALGSCYQRAGKSKDALLAYLHVDVLYSAVPEAHAEALANLATLWKLIGQDGRAREARQTLEQLYSGSKWAK